MDNQESITANQRENSLQNIISPIFPSQQKHKQLLSFLNNLQPIVKNVIQFAINIIQFAI
jgi:hypothetical protein